jgi:hypothetical protein
MKSFKQYLGEKMGDYAADADINPEARLGPKATKANDKKSVQLQKSNLDRLTGEYNQKSKDEGGSGMAKAHADMFANTKKNIHSEETMNEDGGAGGAAGMGAAPANSVAGIAGSGDTRLAPSQREPGVSKKRNPILKGLFRRKPPKA